MPSPQAQRASTGFTLAEVMLATVLVSLVVVAGVRSLDDSVHTKRALEDDPATAFVLAEEIHALALTLPRGTGAGQPATKGADVKVLEDLDGAVFSPPIDATRAAVRGVSDWSGWWVQKVSLTDVDLAVPASVLTSTQTSSRLVQLTVTITQRGNVEGTYHWWLTP